jgi:hypothetical protein
VNPAGKVLAVVAHRLSHKFFPSAPLRTGSPVVVRMTAHTNLS